MSDILNVKQSVLSNDYISKKEYHSYSPYLQSLKNNDEVRITIQNQDLYALPHESYLNINGWIALANNVIRAK